MEQISHNPAEANHESPQATLGGYYHNAGKVYRYVQFHDVATVAVTAGAVVQADGDGPGTVTADISASVDATQGRAYGIALNTPTADYYGYVQVRGYCTNITTDGNVAQGDFLVSGADGVADPFVPADAETTSPNNQDARVFGQALAADASTTLAKAEIWCS